MPGTYLVLERNRLTERRWWKDSVNSQMFSNANMEECAKQLRRVLSKTIKTQIPNGVSVGSYLSGGIDSGTIVALASAYAPRLSTFTCGFNLNKAGGSEDSYSIIKISL